ncbi:PLDc N-terminal domain-containing protein [Arthrobacter sp. NPDC092385]|uniref:PLDc N-terminal domain-containing protein n=1 Tax=Arthrobacter sp. NPDC092385 TaxID=3363943 RepID=UPI0038202B56
MNVVENIWDVFWLFFWFFAMFAYLIVLFQVVIDLFRDRSISGWAKALWVIFLVFLPFLTVLAYLLSRGSGMVSREAARAGAAQEAAEDYIRGLSAPSSAEEIARAKTLLDSGTISGPEFTVLKDRALAGKA